MPDVGVVCYLEQGYESTYEHLAFRQLKGAYKIDLTAIGFDVEKPEDAIAQIMCPKVFVVPPGRIAGSVELADFTPPPGDVVYVFGRPGDDMVRFVAEGDMAVHITTPGDTDMMAITAAGIVMYVCR